MYALLVTKKNTANFLERLALITLARQVRNSNFLTITEVLDSSYKLKLLTEGPLVVVLSLAIGLSILGTASFFFILHSRKTTEIE